MTTLRNCPNLSCSGTGIRGINADNHGNPPWTKYHVACSTCGVRGPWQPSREEGDAAWNALPRAEWRDMEEAPRDGTPFLIAKGNGYDIAEWRGGKLLTNAYWHPDAKVHGWMPLPLPRKENSDG